MAFRLRMHGFLVLALFLVAVDQGAFGASQTSRPAPSPGSVDETFDAGASFDRQVVTVAIDADGAIVIGGFFSAAGSEFRAGVARLRPDGTLDRDFGLDLPGTDDAVTAIAIQPDKKVLIAGRFTRVHGVARDGLARLHLDGSVDHSFADVPGLSGAVGTLVAQPDGKILIGGLFDEIDGQPSPGIARLNADGSLDRGFQNPFLGSGGSVVDMALQPDGRLVIVGPFSQAGGLPRGRIARLLEDGAVDPSFTTGRLGFNLSPTSLAIQQDGKIVLVGDFDSYDDTPRSRVARLDSNGQLDPTYGDSLAFASGDAFSFGLSDVALDPQGRALIAGEFASVNGVPTRRLLRLDRSGQLDLQFQPSLSQPLFTDSLESLSQILVQDDGRLLVVGSSVELSLDGRRGILRLMPDGSVDGSFKRFSGGPNRGVLDIVEQPDGKFLVAGSFSRWNANRRGGLVRLTASGHIDETLTGPRIAAREGIPSIAAVARDEAGRILIGGFFSSVDGQPRNNIARLHPDGTLDRSFGADGSGTFGETCFFFFCVDTSKVFDIVLQPDGTILIAGLFDEVNGEPSRKLARLREDGSLDRSFNSGLDISVTGPGITGVFSIAAHEDGAILAGGQFGQGEVLRVLPDGSIDSAYETAGYGLVWGIEVLTNGMAMIAGETAPGGLVRVDRFGQRDLGFASGLTAARVRVSELVVDRQQRTLVGVSLIDDDSIRSGLARLLPDGSVDLEFGDGLTEVKGGAPLILSVPDVTAIEALALQRDGRLLTGGDFGIVDGQSRLGLCRLLGEVADGDAEHLAP